MVMKWVGLWVLVMVLVVVGLVKVVVVEYYFKVVYMSVVFDCYLKMIIGINGGYFGLIICVMQGDIVKVMFENYVVMEGIIMYWYGICQVRFLMLLYLYL